MRYRAAQIIPWNYGPCCLSQRSMSRSVSSRILIRTYRTSHPSFTNPTEPNPPEGTGGAKVLKERALAAAKHVGELGQQLGQRSAQMATASMNYWWARYEVFVGLNEVREAQTKVTEAEAAFMVARGMVKEAHASLEALRLRLREVRDRLDRVSREEAHYLELATSEHKLLQEERRLRAAYENAEGSERERFSLFSASVRESHEKERTRAERTKNWSVIGSVLGALIGVFGSTYINRVRLLELKNLLQDAQKGPESLQDALKLQAANHRSQQDELQAVIDNLRISIKDPGTQENRNLQEKKTPTTDSTFIPLSTLKDIRSDGQRTESLIQSLQPQVGQLEEGIGRLEKELSVVRGLLVSSSKAQQQQPVRTEVPETPVTLEIPVNLDTPGPWESVTAVVNSLEDTQRMLGEKINRNRVYNAVFTYTATAITVSALYLLLRGPA